MENDKHPELSRRQLFTASGGAVAAALLLTTTSPLMAGTMKKSAKITQVRNATLLIDYAGVTFLVDPLFAEQGSFPGFAGSASSQLNNPLVPLPMAKEELLSADAVIVTHLHEDHWDAAAKAAIAKDKPLFVQNENDAEIIRMDGFTNVSVIGNKTDFKGVTLSKTGGQHGTDTTLEDIPLGEVCGVVFSHTGYATIYVAGDTIWNKHVETAIRKHSPDVIVLNIGNAVLMGYDPIIMGVEDALAVHKAAPKATLIASHMEAINHCILSRATLRDFSVKNGFEKSLLIPADGETLSV